MPMRNDPAELRDYFDAAERDDLETVKKFIEVKGAPVGIGTPGDKQTAAHLAAIHGHLDIVRYMVEKDPLLVEAADNFGDTLFYLAIKNGFLSIVKYLVEERGEKVFQRHRKHLNTTTLNTAIKHGHFDIVKYFFEEKGADVNMGNNLREPPIFTAVVFNRTDIFKYLVEDLNANLKLVDRHDDNILYKTVYSDDMLPLMKYVLDERKAELDINWQNSYGDTLVHRACTQQSFEILKYLVDEKHANIHVRETGNMTALHIAAFKNNHDICQYLIEHGADVEVVDMFGKKPVDRVNVTNFRLMDYFQNTDVTRNRRSINWPYHSILPEVVPYVLPGAQLADRSWDDGAVDRSMEIDDVDSPPIASSSGLTHILVMLSTITGGRRQRQHSDSQDSRIDPIAIDIIDSGVEPFAET